MQRGFVGGGHKTPCSPPPAGYGPGEWRVLSDRHRPPHAKSQNIKDLFLDTLEILGQILKLLWIYVI